MPDPFDPQREPRSYALRVEREIDEDHPPRSAGPEAPASPMSRHAAEWGLASLLTGGFLLLCTAIIVVFNLLFWNTGEHAVMTAARWATQLVVVGAVITALVLMGLGAASVAMGVRALQSAARRRQPAGLAAAGTMVSAAALVLWTLTAIGGIMVILTFAG
jgi:hypothetical protein